MIRPRRSVLYMPANNSRALEKARELPADCIIVDLEDAVAPTAKADARTMAVDAVRAGGFGSRELAIRINPEGSPWFADDLAAVVRSGVDAVVLPKVESAATVQHVADQLPEGMAVWAMIETPRGVMKVDEIALAHARLKVLVMGTSDLAKELRVPHRPDRLGFLYALSRCVVAARVAGVDAIDGVYLDIADSEGFAAICEQGKALGFDGKSLIHPGQLAVANAVFAPSPAELEKAQRILQVWQDAEAAGSGVAVLDGKLVENLHAGEARRLLALAAAICQY
ncbi:MAG TPA: CoA ester lyase [Pseudomonadales bacterium]|nr:CoA ester lyase [Pseudomonadales bacterium]